MTCHTSRALRPGGSGSGDYDEDDEDWEPYTTERLASIPGGYRVLSDVVPTFQLDFNNPQVR